MNKHNSASTVGMFCWESAPEFVPHCIRKTDSLALGFDEQVPPPNLHGSVDDKFELISYACQNDNSGYHREWLSARES